MYTYYKCHKSDLLHYEQEKNERRFDGKLQKKISILYAASTSRREKHNAQKMG